MERRHRARLPGRGRRIHRPHLPAGLDLEHRPGVGESLSRGVYPAAVGPRSADLHGPANMGLLRSILAARRSPLRNVDRRPARRSRSRGIRTTRAVRDDRMRHARRLVRCDLPRPRRRADPGRSARHVHGDGRCSGIEHAPRMGDLLPACARRIPPTQLVGGTGGSPRTRLVPEVRARVGRTRCGHR
jgi:hypothetical protein